MRYIKTDGLVIKSVNVDEADKVLTVFTRKLGKIQILSKGSRRPRNKFMSVSQLFCYADFGIYKSQDMYVLSSSELKESFTGISDDLSKLGSATFVADVIIRTMEEETVNLTLLRLALNTLHKISNSEGDSLKYLVVFMLRFLDVAGFRPQIEKCSFCGDKQFSTQNLYFSASGGGIVCQNCCQNDRNAISLSFSAYKAMVFILFSIDRNMFNFNMSTKISLELYNILKAYYCLHFDTRFTALDYIT